MVAKITSGNSLYGILSYNQNKVESDNAKVIFTNRMIVNDDGNFDIRSCLQSFEPYISANKRTEKPVLHISLNPDPKDILSDEQLSEIAQFCMQKMGYGDQPFIVYKHEDIDRHHIHIVSLRVDENGKKIDHNFEHRRSMAVCRELEQKYGLIPADKKKRQNFLPLNKVDYEKGDIKHQIGNVIRSVAKDYHFLSFNEYKAVLSLFNVGVEEVKTPKGQLYGDERDLEVGYEVSGLMYFALNEKGEKVGTPVKSSKYDETVGITALEKRIKNSYDFFREKRPKERSKTVIASLMQTVNNRSDFEKELEKNRISVIFRENEQGRIYGVTFVDHERKCVFNGSGLGKEFSANVFNNLFNGTGNNPDNTFKHYEKQPFEPFEKQDKEFSENSNFGGILDMFASETVQDEMEEQAFTNRLKKKKKRQRRL